MTTAPIVKRHVWTGDPATPDLCTECGAPAASEHHLPAVELNDKLQRWLEEVRLVDQNIATIRETLLAPLEERRERAITNLQAALGDNEAATIGGRVVLTWAWSKPADGIDLAALRRDLPEVFQTYYKPKRAARPFKPVTP